MCVTLPLHAEILTLIEVVQEVRTYDRSHHDSGVLVTISTLIKIIIKKKSLKRPLALPSSEHTSRKQLSRRKQNFYIKSTYALILNISTSRIVRSTFLLFVQCIHNLCCCNAFPRKLT